MVEHQIAITALVISVAMTLILSVLVALLWASTTSNEQTLATLQLEDSVRYSQTSRVDMLSKVIAPALDVTNVRIENNSTQQGLTYSTTTEFDPQLTALPTIVADVYVPPNGGIVKLIVDSTLPLGAITLGGIPQADVSIWTSGVVSILYTQGDSDDNVLTLLPENVNSYASSEYNSVVVTFSSIILAAQSVEVTEK